MPIARPWARSAIAREVRFKHLAFNAPRMGPHEVVASQLLQGRALHQVTGRAGPILYGLLPLSLAAYAALLLRRNGLAGTAWLESARTDQPVFFASLLIVYTTLVSIAFEYGENDRFKFVVEQPIWAFVVVIGFRGRGAWRRPAPGPGAVGGPAGASR